MELINSRPLANYQCVCEKCWGVQIIDHSPSTILTFEILKLLDIDNTPFLFSIF